MLRCRGWCTGSFAVFLSFSFVLVLGLCFFLPSVQAWDYQRSLDNQKYMPANASTFKKASESVDLNNVVQQPQAVLQEKNVGRANADTDPFIALMIKWLKDGNGLQQGIAALALASSGETAVDPLIAEIQSGTLKDATKKTMLDILESIMKDTNLKADVRKKIYDVLVSNGRNPQFIPSPEPVPTPPPGTPQPPQPTGTPTPPGYHPPTPQPEPVPTPPPAQTPKPTGTPTPPGWKPTPTATPVPQPIPTPPPTTNNK